MPNSLASGTLHNVWVGAVLGRRKVTLKITCSIDLCRTQTPFGYIHISRFGWLDRRDLHFGPAWAARGSMVSVFKLPDKAMDEG